MPAWFPVDTDVTVLASGAVEVGLGAGLVLSRRRVTVGLVAAAFFVAIFPGNVGQWLEHKDGFGLDTDRRRLARLFFQPVLVAWALWSTGALEALPEPAALSDRAARAPLRAERITRPRGHRTRAPCVDAAHEHHDDATPDRADRCDRCGARAYVRVFLPAAS